MEFSYEYTIIVNSENIPLNLEPKQNALFQALRVQWNLLLVRDLQFHNQYSLLYYSVVFVYCI